MLRELLPNVALPMMVFTLITVAVLIVGEGALSFLGLGVPPPMPSWGSMMSEGREQLDFAPHIAFIPAIVMFLTVLSFNLVGDCAALADRPAARRAVTVALLEVENLSVELPTARGPLRALAGVSLRLEQGRALGVVGESGSGKTMLSRAILRLLPPMAQVSGSTRFDGKPLLTLGPGRRCGRCAARRSPSSSRTR
jgi:ABC-type multidrug transport system fused ATPase/permease subunit